jgi:stage V sporulation protein S
MRAIGASAVNQSVKACAIARGFVAPRGLDVSYIIGFDDIIGDNGDQISAMFFRPVVR